jgi:hypothetical protein
MMDRIQHDHAWACVSVLEDMVGHVMRPEEIAEFRAQTYEALRAMLHHYELSVDRQQLRLHPEASKN